MFYEGKVTKARRKKKFISKDPSFHSVGRKVLEKKSKTYKSYNSYISQMFQDIIFYLIIPLKSIVIMTKNLSGSALSFKTPRRQ